MDRATFDSYVETYNNGDMEGLQRFYADDIVFENFGNHHEGADVIAFLEGIHEAITDTLIPRAVVIDGDEIAMEFDDDITAKVDLPDLPAGAMRAGDHVVVRTFAFYATDGDKITHIRIAGWPPREIE